MSERRSFRNNESTLRSGNAGFTPSLRLTPAARSHHDIHEVRSSAIRTIDSPDNQFKTAQGGNLWKGMFLALLCQVAYLLVISELPFAEQRVLGYMLFALVQFVYLFPLAIFFQRRNQGLTSSGVLITSMLSILAAAAWFGYAAMHGTLPSFGIN